MCLLVNFLHRKEEFINCLLILNGVLMGKYNNSTGAKLGTERHYINFNHNVLQMDLQSDSFSPPPPTLAHCLYFGNLSLSPQ